MCVEKPRYTAVFITSPWEKKAKVTLTKNDNFVNSYLFLWKYMISYEWLVDYITRMRNGVTWGKRVCLSDKTTDNYICK